MSPRKAAKGASAGRHKRRRNYELRERLDEIVELARTLSQSGSGMSSEALDEARQRIEWLAEEIWESAVYGPLEERTRPPPPAPGEEAFD